MGFFSKKNCSVCGGKIGLLGNRKLEDGNLCKDCAKKLSPFFSDRRRSTVADIEEQLKYREDNEAALANLNVTRTLGNRTRIHLDEAAGKFVVSSARRWQDGNPDILDLSQVTGCEIEVQESKKEQKRKDSEGKEQSYIPPRYTYEYDFYVLIHVNSPWFDRIRFQLNDSTLESERAMTAVSKNAAYEKLESQGEEIRQILLQTQQTRSDQIASAQAPKTAGVCPACGAVSMPDSQGRCEYCGTPMPAGN